MDIDTIISDVDKLPPSLKILPQLRRILTDDDATIDDMALLIKQDASLTAQVLRLCNSPYYGANESTHDIDEALNRIGSQEVYKIVALTSAGKLYNTDMPFYKLMKVEIHELTARCAHAMQSMASATGVSQGDAYVIGLLHAIGKIVIHNYILNHISGNAKFKDYNSGLHPQDEVDILGFDRGEVAAALLKKWHFPECLCIPIQYQNNPLDAPSEKHMACMLALCQTELLNRIRSTLKKDRRIIFDKQLGTEIELTNEAFTEFIEKSEEALEMMHASMSDPE